jgi:pilus assembly protein Flp/PilA
MLEGRTIMMSGFVHRAKAFLKSEDGPTATEYAVMLALIIIVALGAITGLGTTVDAIFTNVDSSLPTGSSS